MALRSEEVARYLERHPEFFEEYSEMVSTITIPHPDGGRAIPIVERQILSLRKKNRNLESKLKDLIGFAEENDHIAERMHRIGISMLRAQTLEALLHSFYFHLREDFAVPHASFRIWGAAQASELPEFGAAAPETQSEAAVLSHPLCGAFPFPGTADWFGEDTDAARLRSCANVPLAHERWHGLLVLASEDAQRFYSGMGTVFLKRLGEMLSASLARFLPD